MNSPMQPDQHGYGDKSDCLCGRNFKTVRGLREHLTKSRKVVTDTDLLLKLSDQAVTMWRARAEAAEARVAELEAAYDRMNSQRIQTERELMAQRDALIADRNHYLSRTATLEHGITAALNDRHHIEERLLALLSPPTADTDRTGFLCTCGHRHMVIGGTVYGCELGDVDCYCTGYDRADTDPAQEDER